MKRAILSSFFLAFAALATHGATYGQKVVAAVLCGEARGEGVLGMGCVAEVIRTRAQAWRITPLQVVTRKGAFECMLRSNPDRLVRKYEHTREFSAALLIAVGLYNHPESIGHVTNGATHFERTTAPKPSWALGHKPVAVIGRHSFYRLKI